ncbi:MAG: hypothetical protein IKM04_06940 [Clostridia bacterium]|nr:hypothetical protein [Clostridia bacterium]
MKKISILSLCIVIVLMLSVLVSCSGGSGSKSDKKLAGSYSGNYIYDGAEISIVITLNEDGTYTYDATKDGQPSSSRTGDYELKDGEVYLYNTSDHQSWIKYDYVDGHLENENGEFTKK